jgi:hypothetical protein
MDEQGTLSSLAARSPFSAELTFPLLFLRVFQTKLGSTSSTTRGERLVQITSRMSCSRSSWIASRRNGSTSYISFPLFRCACECFIS